MAISTHILDTTRGRPASGVDVTLEKRSEGGWHICGRGQTNEDGRIKPLGDSVEAGTYRIVFAVEPYLQAQHGDGFYPEIAIAFLVKNPAEHFHVPLLLNPFGYATYRGS